MPVRPRNHIPGVSRKAKSLRINATVLRVTQSKNKLEFRGCVAVGAPPNSWTGQRAATLSHACGRVASSPRRAIGNALRKLGAKLEQRTRTSAFKGKRRRRRT